MDTQTSIPSYRRFRDTVSSRTVFIDGLRSHYLEAGQGPLVVLLHSGEFGASAESSWYSLMPTLVRHGYRVIAPDWLGFGDSEMVVDFADPTGRRLRHLEGLLAHLNLDRAAFIGSSMGGTYLARLLASPECHLHAACAVLISGGGFVPFNDARKRLLDYDLTPAGMSRLLSTLTVDWPHAVDEDYVSWRHELSTVKGAWQCVASARLRPPSGGGAGDDEFGKPDGTEYGLIDIPTLVVAGQHDPLRLPDYGAELAEQLPRGELVEVAAGHLPHLERPLEVEPAVLDFLKRHHPPTGITMPELAAGHPHASGGRARDVPTVRGGRA